MESHDQVITLAGKWMVRTKIAADGIGQILNVSISQLLTKKKPLAGNMSQIIENYHNILLSFAVIVLDI
jgi:hypothetical protein